MPRGRRLALVILLAATAVAVIAAPLVMLRGARFGGADEQARAVIEKTRPQYRPWMEPLWRPPGPEMETLIFSLQAAAGAGVVGYAIGYFRGRRAAGGRQ